jgi:tetratricopeptide (TPR) repeat protein
MITDKEFKAKLGSFKSLRNSISVRDFVSTIEEYIEELYGQNEHSRIVEIFHSDFCYPKVNYYFFEVAFSLNKNGFVDEAEIVYENILRTQPNNTAVLNNLSLIKLSKNKINEAYKLINHGYEVDPHDQNISTNIKTISLKYQEMQKYHEFYKKCSTYLADENDFVLNKLKTFLLNVDKDPTCKLGKIPIPSWKFSVLMATDKQKATSLKDQWIEKYYIRATDEKGDYSETIYEINPLLKLELDKISNIRLNDKWLKGFENLSLTVLNEFGYFEIKTRLNKVNKKFRDLILRDFDELVINHVIKNEKTVVVLSGSLIEALLTYHCEKKKILKIKYQKGNKTIHKNLHDCDLGDLLTFFEQQNVLGDLIVHLGNISRIQRNYVHPGKELREKDTLDDSKAELCFISTLEIIKQIT